MGNRLYFLHKNVSLSQKIVFVIANTLATRIRISEIYPWIENLSVFRDFWKPFFKINK